MIHSHKGSEDEAVDPGWSRIHFNQCHQLIIRQLASDIIPNSSLPLNNFNLEPGPTPAAEAAGGAVERVFFLMRAGVQSTSLV